jgi:hypothetical protein
MKKMLMLCSVFLLVAITTQAQVIMQLSPGDSLRQEGNLKGAIEAYRQAYAEDSLYVFTLYNMACAYAVCNMKDSAFKYINKALSPTLDFDLRNILSTLTDPDFIKLHDDPRWSKVENRVITTVESLLGTPIRDVPLAKRLLRMRALDQAYYGDLKIAEAKTGHGSSVVAALWDLKTRINDKNLEDLEQIIKDNGWPRISQVGSQAADAAFLIIQHNSVEKQKKYLSTLKKLCEEKEATWQSYALMYDRVRTWEDKPQRYGSQVRFNEGSKRYELFPLEDATMVDKWRAEAGLGPLAEYVSRWDIKWEAPKK